MNEQKQTGQDVAMLMRVKVSKWGASKKDKEESRKLCKDNNAKEGSANVFIQMVDKKELDPIQNAKYLLTDKVWKRYTLPWIDDGVRILPAKNYNRCKEEIEEAIEYFNSKVEEFIQRFPEICANAKPNLGNFLRNNPLPTVEELRSKFKIEVSYMPIPKATDFNVSGIDSAINEIRRNITNSVSNAMEEATNVLYDELVTLVTKIQETTSVKDKIFRDTLIGNLKDFCERLPDLNISKDARLNELCKECVQEFAKIDPQDLRKDKKFRKATSIKADEMVKKIRKIDLDMD